LSIVALVKIESALLNAGKRALPWNARLMALYRKPAR
jgi:hypothetical protein